MVFHPGVQSTHRVRWRRPAQVPGSGKRAALGPSSQPDSEGPSAGRLVASLSPIPWVRAGEALVGGDPMSERRRDGVRECAAGEGPACALPENRLAGGVECLYARFTV